MFKNKFFMLFVVTCILLSACGAPPAPQNFEQPNNGLPPVENANQPGAVTQNAAPNVNSGESAAHHSDVDLTHLELGNGKTSDNPQRGYVYSCRGFSNVPARADGSWYNSDGTWDATKKLTVDGSVNWPSSFTVSIQGDQRVLVSNDLPNHPTGNYPISPSDDAYQYDRNPGSISAQSISLSFPVNPVAGWSAECVGGEVGILLSGVPVFSAFDADGRDASANEIQDNCDGHPQKDGMYHYHSLSDCIEDTANGHSALAGYAFDGFGIYGYYGEDGAEVTNADLDECHGHEHAIEWDGQSVVMYHYHATHQFPYVVGCFHGPATVHGPLGAGGQTQGGQGQQPPAGGDTQGGQGQPPQEALDACANQAQDAACSFTTPNGTISGTCKTPPNASQMACVPAGGPPPSP